MSRRRRARGRACGLLFDVETISGRASTAAGPDESPEWMPASSMLHHTADDRALAVRDAVDVDLDRVLQELVDEDRLRRRPAPPATARRCRLREVGARVRDHPSRARRARSSDARRPGSWDAPPAIRRPPMPVRDAARGALRRPSFVRASSKRPRSSARSMVSAVVRGLARRRARADARA